MENAVAEIKKESAPAREIGVITAEIKDLCRQAQTMALLYAVEIGRRLDEAKRALPYRQAFRTYLDQPRRASKVDARL